MCDGWNWGLQLRARVSDLGVWSKSPFLSLAVAVAGRSRTFVRMYLMRPSPTSHDRAYWMGPCARVARSDPSWSEANRVRRSSAKGTGVQLS